MAGKFLLPYKDAPPVRPHHLSMERALRRIVALGGHDFSSRPPDRAVGELMLRLARERAGGRPRVCVLASDGASSGRTARFHTAFGARSCEASVLSVARLSRRPSELRAGLLAQDLIYVEGGGLPDLLAQWDALDLGGLLSLAWRQGTVLAGQGCGAMCWFEAGITTAAGKPVTAAGLGLLDGSLCVHYRNEPERRAVYLAAVADGMPGGWGVDDHAVLLWEGDGPPTALTARRGARAYRVMRGEAGVVEAPVPARILAAPAPAALREDIAEYRRIRAMRRRAGWRG